MILSNIKYQKLTRQIVSVQILFKDCRRCTVLKATSFRKLTQTKTYAHCVHQLFQTRPVFTISGEPRTKDCTKDCVSRDQSFQRNHSFEFHLKLNNQSLVGGKDFQVYSQQVSRKTFFSDKYCNTWRSHNFMLLVAIRSCNQCSGPWGYCCPQPPTHIRHFTPHLGWKD